MFAILHALGMFVANLFKSRSRLEAENLFLRHQLAIALRRAPPRFRLRGGDRALLIWMTRLCPSLLSAAQVVQPETILRWHRAGCNVFWRWKSRKRAGRPKIKFLQQYAKISTTIPPIFRASNSGMSGCNFSPRRNFILSRPLIGPFPRSCAPGGWPTANAGEGPK